MRLTTATTKRLTGLTPTQRTKVIAIVKRHTDACERQGVVMENTERLVIEAMDEVQADRADDYLGDVVWSSHAERVGEVRSYEQYRSPVDCGRW